MPPIPPPSIPLLRAFSRTLTTASSTAAEPTPPPPLHSPSKPPPYPYGTSQIYKQRNHGLYGTSMIRFGNTVSEKNEIKNRRTWKPNIHSKRLWSDALDRYVRVRVQGRVLRTIDKVGGLDEYVLGDRPGRIKELGPWGWAFRWRLFGTERVRERFREERRRLGLPEEGIKGEMGVGRDGREVGRQVLVGQYEAFDEELDAEDGKRDGRGASEGETEG